jgi:hypothetical protein
VRKGGFEPPRSCERQPLKTMRLGLLTYVVTWNLSCISVNKMSAYPAGACRGTHPLTPGRACVEPIETFRGVTSWTFSVTAIRCAAA